jgi:hypothetical protein
MNEPAYPLNNLRFSFDSISSQKHIRKVIEYAPLDSQNQFFNLALVDENEDGSFSDMIVSNNNDMTKVLATVVHTLQLFFKVYPEALVTFKGSTTSRTRLYRIAISRSLKEAESIFDIWGFQGAELERFIPDTQYDSFVIGLRQQKQ